MGRYKCQVNVWRNRGVTGERDSPAKLALSRRTKFRTLPPIKHHEVEEPDQSVLTVISADPTLKSFKPIHSESVTSKGNTSSPVSPALGKPGPQVSPAGRSALKMTPDEEKLSVRPEDITSSNTESDTTFSSGDDEEDCCSSSSSLPSPEIFRTESYIATVTLTDQLAHHPYKKNSTLLDVSHAESIHMYHPPNLSTIIDGSSILPEKKGEINPLLGPEAETELKTTSLKPVKPSLNSGTKTPPKLSNRRPISYRKKVWFKSPIISETFDIKHIPAENITPHSATEPVSTASLAEKDKPDMGTPRAGESSFKEAGVSLKSSETAKFFDFETERDMDMFLLMMRERSARLRSGPLFPLAAVKPTNLFVL